MIYRFKLSPFSTVVENRLFPGTVEYGICHLLTGNVLPASPELVTLVKKLAAGTPLVLNEQTMEQGKQGLLSLLLKAHYIIDEQSDPLQPFYSYLLVRPRQNPAVSYQLKHGETKVVRTSMLEHCYSPAVNQAPDIFEEVLTDTAGTMLSLADGTKTLFEVFQIIGAPDAELSEALTFLSSAERQLVKLAPDPLRLADPFQPFNSVPRTLYTIPWPSEDAGQANDFHSHGIADADWEFDWIEPTVNHSFRFPTPAFGGLSYGARFCEAVLNAISESRRGLIQLLEVGGGTGSFARSFLDHARTKFTDVKIEYHLLDLSPTLMRQQEDVLVDYLSPERHYHQDATRLDLDKIFDLIISNEVVADFPVALAERVSVEGKTEWRGDAASYIVEFGLEEEDTPDSFLVNTGLFEFLRRAWDHLAPGGLLVLTEYGGLNKFPERSYHLNHDEYSIHFGHVEKCAQALGFAGRVLPLSEFLSIDEGVEFLDGREEKILCLNKVLKEFGEALPYAAISREEFWVRFKSLSDEIKLGGITFSPLTAEFHYGPFLKQFFAAILQKPLD